jgi:ribosome-associated heat shock protein Hsp15
MTADSQGDGQRLDQWLWFARFAKTRTLAQAFIERGKVRVNAAKVVKVSHWLKAGDAITLSVGHTIRIVKVLGFGKRRGPAPEAAGLYEELTPRPDKTTSVSNTAETEGSTPSAADTFQQPFSGRPNKRERRVIVRVKGRER